MKCSTCNHEAPAGSAFCPHCGQRIERMAQDDTVVGPASLTLPPTAMAPRTEGAAPGRTAAADAGIYTEEELWTGRYSPKAMLGTWIMAGLISIGLIILGAVVNKRDLWIAVTAGIVLLLLGALIAMTRRRVGKRYRLTTQRLILESGLVSLTTDRIDIIDINDITVEQGPIARLLGLGTIIVRSTDKTHAELKMEGIENVNHVADLMDNARRAVQRRRGLRIDVNAPGDAIDQGHNAT
jgi:membrane protein YdbS with pleckstrin-like domain